MADNSLQGSSKLAEHAADDPSRNGVPFGLLDEFDARVVKLSFNFEKVVSVQERLV